MANNTLGKETRGTTPDMVWVRGPHGEGLFKPDLTEHDFLCEQFYCQVAKIFGIEPAPIEEGSLNGVSGFLSYKPELRRHRVLEGYDVKCPFDLASIASLANEETVSTLKRVMFADAICNNIDRHAGNVSFFANYMGDIQGVLPMYDNVICGINSINNFAMLAPDSTKQWRHKEVFDWLRANWDEFDGCYEDYISEELDSLLRIALNNNQENLAFFFEQRQLLCEQPKTEVKPLKF